MHRHIVQVDTRTGWIAFIGGVRVGWGLASTAQVEWEMLCKSEKINIFLESTQHDKNKQSERHGRFDGKLFLNDTSTPFHVRVGDVISKHFVFSSQFGQKSVKMTGKIDNEFELKKRRVILMLIEVGTAQNDVAHQVGVTEAAVSSLSVLFGNARYQGFFFFLSVAKPPRCFV